MDMKELLEKNNIAKPPKTGDLIEGKVISHTKSAVYLDLGPIGTGIIFGREFLDAKNKLKDLKSGDSLFAKIVDLENDQGYLELSISQAGNEMAWDNLKQIKETGELIEVKILSANKGGLLAQIQDMPAFLPVSQLSSEHYPRVEGGDPQKILRELQKLVGQTLQVKIFDLKPKTGEVIISEKAKETEKIKEILKSYEVGQIIEGEITGLTDFGAFIKFPARHASPAKHADASHAGWQGDAGGGEGLEGLIHISELDWKIIENPADIVKIGEIVKAKIIDISDGKISLSLKALKEDPWLNIEEKYKKGDAVEGQITKFNPFGAFVQITEKVQGLCHISEFGSYDKMQESLAVGKSYKFEILLIDPKEHKMSLKPAVEK